jgi:hypothetical protein
MTQKRRLLPENPISPSCSREEHPAPHGFESCPGGGQQGQPVTEVGPHPSVHLRRRGIQGPGSSCLRGCREPSRLLPTKAVATEDGPHPPVEREPSSPGVSVVVLGGRSVPGRGGVHRRPSSRPGNLTPIRQGPGKVAICPVCTTVALAQSQVAGSSAGGAARATGDQLEHFRTCRGPVGRGM